MEIELKLLLNPGDIAAFCRLPLLRQYAHAKPVTRLLTSIYFDTPRGKLLRHGAGLRVRRVGARGRWVQTLKAGGDVAGGLHQRHEWETPVASAQPALDKLCALIGDEYPAAAWLKPALAARLAPVFTTRLQRTCWQLCLDGGEEIELALDQGRVFTEHAGVESSEDICEIELELKSGSAAALFDFARQLHQHVPLRLSNISKAERGYALAAPEARMRSAVPAPSLTADLGLRPAFRTVIAACLAHIQVQEAAVVQGQDPEGVHQMRVGLRRLYTLLNLFPDMTPLPAPLAKELLWLGQVLSTARDWEVLANSTLPKVSRAGIDAADESALRAAAQRRAKQKLRLAANAVAAPRYTGMMLALGAWLSRAASAAPAQPSMPLDSFARQLLKQCRKSLRRRAQQMDKAVGAAEIERARHRLRIAAKKLRYAAEAFHELFAPKPLHALVARLSALQDALGALNDYRVGASLLQGLGSAQPALATAANRVRSRLAARTEEEGHEIAAHWRRFERCRLP